MTIIMGLDASTSTFGLAIIKKDGYNIELIHIEYYKPPKDGNIFERLTAVKKYINEKLEKFNPDFIAIEEFVQFMKGRSGAKTIIPLALFNRTVGLTAYEWLQKNNKMQTEPNLCNVNSVRAKLKLGKERPSKEQIPDLVANILQIEFPWITKINKKTKLPVKIEENYDISDSIAVALYHIKTNGIKLIKKKKVRKKKNEQNGSL